VLSEKCGLVAVVGAPNAGKSTLVNALIGQKVAIVSAKAQTTRVRLMGIALHGEAQILLLDTPGIFEPRRRLDRAMVAAAWGGAQDADLIVLVVDAKTGFSSRIEAMLDTLKKRREPKMLVLNKVDLVKKEELLALTVRLSERLDFEQIFMVSAMTGDGVADLKQTLADRVPEGPWHFPEDQVSDATDRMLAAEVTREQLYHQLHAELPYASAVETEKYEERRDGSVVIHQQILVGRPTQKAIVLGKGGARIKEIGAAAREELGRLLGRKVHLFLHVKVKPDWEEDRGLYREIGLDWVE
jgi:GTPase